jgi:inhibitor of cysteine peptidase
MKTRWFLIAVLVPVLLLVAVSSLATAGTQIPTFVRTNAEMQIPQVVTIQTSESYAVAKGMLLYSENGISVIVIENKTLTNGDGIKTYYIDFVASQLPPIAYRILIYPLPPIDTYVVRGMASPELRAILAVDVPKLENQLFTENSASGIKSATAQDILRQFAIWAYMGVDLASMKGYWLSIGLSDGGWMEAENWLASFAKASPARDITELDSSISASYDPKGYSAVEIGLTNNGTDEAYVRAEVGTVLNNKDKANQNITIGETGVVLVPAGESKRVRLESYCINLSKGTPMENDVLFPTKGKNENLFILLSRAAGAGYTGMNRQYQVQDAVWSITDGRETYSAEAQRLLSDNSEIKTWNDLSAAPWDSESSTVGTNYIVPVAIILAMSLAIVWLFLKRKTVVKMWVIAIILVVAIAVTLAPLPLTHTGTTGLTTHSHSNVGWQQIFDQNQLRKFSSYKELEHFVETNLVTYREGLREGLYAVWGTTGGSSFAVPSFSFNLTNTGFLDYTPAPKAVVSGDYSTTNIQVLGVDEADIVKTDGKYVYAVSGNTVVIIDAYPAENARILSKIKMEENPIEIFINENKLIVFGSTFIKVYDVSDREIPILSRDVSFDGNYFDSRMIGDYVYVIVSSPINYQGEIELPKISSDGKDQPTPANEIYYFDVPDYSYNFTTIISVNTQNDAEEITKETFLIGWTQNIYVSSNNIYITNTNIYITNTTYDDGKILNSMEYPETTEETIIHKISIADGKIEYKSWGEVPGTVLNQFSMDEYQGYFRIATTIGWMENNNVYVLDNDLKVVGKLEGLAPGEKIYSARFMGNRAYLVTFKKIDPLFVVDLKDPENPTVLGELKIPGFSDYLHPYDENHIIGVGKNAVDEGSFAWYQGIKIALFDVSDPQNPVEISNYAIGDRGTDSYVLTDHKAFLFSRSKNLLVMPISLAKIDENKYPDGVPPYAYGDFVWQGVYVFNVSLENGFVFKGGITHMENNVDYSYPPYSVYYPYSDYSVKRSLYIGDVLYTISDGLIKMNNLDNLSEINEVALPGGSNIYEDPWGAAPGVRVVIP